MKELTVESIAKALESICCEEDLQPYKDLGNGLYELPGNVICNKKGLDKYLNTISNESRNNC
jgi:hypothetical protein